MSATRLDHWLDGATRRLAAAGVDSARLDARLLAAHVLGADPRSLVLRGDAPLTEEQGAALEALVRRRQSREPVSHILGRRGFWTLELQVSSAVLDPRPDTETVVSATLALRPDRGLGLAILDLGTGSGCILLALLSEYPNARGLGIDKSPEALAVASANAVACGLAGRAAFREGDWDRGLADAGFDLVVSNPPYIPDGAIGGLAPEVARFEPHLALAGGADGLDCYRVLAPAVARLLKPGGLVLMEVGEGQAEAVSALLEGAGLEGLAPIADLGGILRVVAAKKSVGKRPSSD